jgi:hypothetical protein
MKLYTIYSPSHKRLYKDFFLKSLPNEFEVISEEIKQECPTGEFYKEGWNLTCYRKIELFIKACEENLGNHFVFSDVDIQFFGNIKQTLLDEIGDFDIACQNDTAHFYCSGFFICKANEKTLHMFKEMQRNYVNEDQTSLNLNIHLVKSKFLSKKFFTIAHLTGSPWNGEDFNLPYDILMHHANWTVGTQNKTNLLERVREKMMQKITK